MRSAWWHLYESCCVTEPPRRRCRQTRGSFVAGDVAVTLVVEIVRRGDNCLVCVLLNLCCRCDAAYLA